jgi:hypothetical protein
MELTPWLALLSPRDELGTTTHNRLTGPKGKMLSEIQLRKHMSFWLI